jgi:hypothetical protein
VARCYQEAGFDFLAISDHNHLTLPEEAGPKDPAFLLLPASEYSGLNGKNIHVNGLGLTQPFAPTRLEGIVETLQQGVDQAHAQGALAMLNHPNWRWSYGAKEIAAVKGADLFELYGGAYNQNNEGAPGHPGTEAIWDELLSQGYRIWGAGSDDCHKFKAPFDPYNDPPATGWTTVEAESLSVENILASLKSGRFYTSTRIQLEAVSASRQELKIRIKPWYEIQFYTRFIGRGGRLLGEVDGLEPAYQFKGDEGYVRAKICCSDRHHAWTQPVFI